MPVAPALRSTRTAHRAAQPLAALAQVARATLLGLLVGTLLAGCTAPARGPAQSAREPASPAPLSADARARLPSPPPTWLAGQPTRPEDLRAATKADAPAARVEATAVLDLAPPAAWWGLYGDPTLVDLVEVALRKSPTAEAARARIGQARALADLAQAQAGPQGRWQTRAGRARGAGEARAEPQLGLGLDLAWDADLGGREAATLDAARHGVVAAQADADAVRLALAADTAQAWLQLRAHNERLRLQQDSIANAQALLELLQAQREAGRASGLDLARQRAQLAEERAALAPLELQRQRWRNTLGALLGRAPGEVPEPARHIGLAELAPPPLQAGLPAELLLRRPAVRRAEWRLAQAEADVAAARAALLPRLALDASVGLSARELAGLLQPAAWLHGLVLQLAGSLFDGRGAGDGAGRARVALAQADREERVQAYAQALVDGWREAEDALASLRENQRQAESLALAVEAGQQAVDLAQARLRLGAADLGLVLDARRTLLAQQHALLQARQARILDSVALYRAVGGSWPDPATTPPGLGTTEVPSTRPRGPTDRPGTAPAGMAGQAPALASRASPRYQGAAPPL